MRETREEILERGIRELAIDFLEFLSLTEPLLMFDIKPKDKVIMSHLHNQLRRKLQRYSEDIFLAIEEK